MHKGFLLTGSALGAITVALGAFGAHALQKLVPPAQVSVFDTGVKYQFYHVFALLLLAVIFERFPGPKLEWAGYCFLAGIVLFSGSLYILTAIKAAGKVGSTGLGILTPIGGLFLIAGWVLLFLGVLTDKRLG